jgi:hypothetical protein
VQGRTKFVKAVWKRRDKIVFVKKYVFITVERDGKEYLELVEW